MDIVERLDSVDVYDHGGMEDLLADASAEIERLRIEVTATRDAMDEWRIAAMDMRDALIVAQNALLMVTQPNEIERTSSANAYFACVEAEVRARAAIGEWKE